MSVGRTWARKSMQRMRRGNAIETLFCAYHTVQWTERLPGSIRWHNVRDIRLWTQQINHGFTANNTARRCCICTRVNNDSRGVDVCLLEVVLISGVSKLQLISQWLKLRWHKVHSVYMGRNGIEYKLQVVIDNLWPMGKYYTLILKYSLTLCATASPAVC